MRHAYLNHDEQVVQIVSGTLEGESHDMLLRDYAVLYGAIRCVRVPDDEVPIWIGGSLIDGEFTPPPTPPVELTEGV